MYSISQQEQLDRLYRRERNEEARLHQLAQISRSGQQDEGLSIIAIIRSLATLRASHWIKSLVTAIQSKLRLDYIETKNVVDRSNS